MQTLVAATKLNPTLRQSARQPAPWLSLALYMALSALLFPFLRDYTNNIQGIGADPLECVWFLQWCPWSLGHLTNPFYTRLVWFPTGYPMTWTTSVPTLSLLALPLTLLANAVIAYNVLILLAPVLSAWTAFLLARCITQDTPAAFVAGLLFGFSSYEIAQRGGHLNLAATFLVPIIAHLVLARVDGTLSRRRFVSYLALCMWLQFGISIEIFATLCVLGGIACLVFLALAPARERQHLRATLLEACLAGVVLVVALSPFLISMARTSHEIPSFYNPPIAYSSDLFNFFIPTIETRVGSNVFANISAHFTGNTSEQDAYLGLPLLLIMILYAQSARRSGVALLVATIIVALASLGPQIWINGHQTGVPGPWRLFTFLPLIKGALPSRFSMYVSLGAGLITALWLAEAVSRSGRVARFGLAAFAYLLLLPNPYLDKWSPVPRLPFFEPANVETELGRGANVLILPLVSGGGMFWQYQSGMRFTQSGGYTSMVPNSFARLPVVQALLSGVPELSFADDFRAFCIGHAVTTVIIGPGTPPALERALDALAWPSKRERGVRLLRIPSAA